MNNRNARMNNKNAIRIAIVGVGNCASSLIQGIHYYTRERCRQGASGLMHTQIGGYLPCDIASLRLSTSMPRVGNDVSGHLKSQLHEGFQRGIDSGAGCMGGSMNIRAC